ncbi:MAG: hypothetical protein ACTSRE_08065 [Promethearchaeota archaeon]
MNKKELILFFSGIALSALLAWVLSITGIWQLVLIAGFAAGVLNYSMGRGCLSGGIGVFIGWGGIVLNGIINNNPAALLDAFGSIMGLTGIAWVFYILVVVFGFLFGVLGGALGGGFIRLIVPKEREE